MQARKKEGKSYKVRLILLEKREAGKELIKGVQKHISTDKKWKEMAIDSGLEESGGIIRCIRRMKNSELSANARNPYFYLSITNLQHFVLRELTE